MASRAFYTLADSSYFLGLVALVNSLRLHGHREPIYVLDCGLTDADRELVEPEVTLVPAPPDQHPLAVKTYAALHHPGREMIVLDADMIVTRPLTPLFDAAAAGVVVTFADPAANRFDPRWPELLGLPGQHRHAYANAGLIAVPEALLPLLEELYRLCLRIDMDRSTFVSRTGGDPFYYVDQDVLNALLGSRLRPDGYVIDEHRLAPHPPFRGLRVLDPAHLRCAYGDGVEPLVLHHVYRKPWHGHVRASLYSAFLMRLLFGADVAVRPPADRVPLRLHPGAAGSEARAISAIVSRISEQRGRLGIRRRLAQRRTREPDGFGLRAAPGR